MVSSNGPCKRSIHEVDDPAIPPASSKRTLTGYAEGNQENCDPTVSISEDTAISSEKQNDTTPSFSTAETLVQQVDLSHSNTESLSANAPTAPLNATHCHESTPPVQSSTPLPIEKNQKVSPIKKGAKQQEKEAKERQKIEERLKREEERRLKADEKKRREAMRDEERRLKEEEKKKREAEREEKKKSKEEEKAAKEAAKEDEKRRKEEAKLKKERVSFHLSVSLFRHLTCCSRRNPNSTLSSRDQHFLLSHRELSNSLLLQENQDPMVTATQIRLPSRSSQIMRKSFRNFLCCHILLSRLYIVSNVTLKPLSMFAKLLTNA